MTVMAPIDEDELVAMLDFALDMKGPCALRYPRLCAADKEKKRECPPVEHGKGVLLEDGRDVAIIALGSMVYPSLDAVEILKTEGISCLLYTSAAATAGG